MNKKELIHKLHEINALQFGEFRLKSGIISPIYLDLRQIVSHPEVLKAIAEEVWCQIKDLQFDLICGVPYTALPIATAVSVAHDVPMVMRRKEMKDYGTKKIIEGHYQPGQRCLVIEDLITSGLSLQETIDPLKKEGLNVVDIAVVVDREQGGRKNLEEERYRLHTSMTITEILDELTEAGKLDPIMSHAVRNFIHTNQISFQTVG